MYVYMCIHIYIYIYLYMYTHIIYKFIGARGRERAGVRGADRPRGHAGGAAEEAHIL